MSLTTLESKIQMLIEKAKYGNIYIKMLKNEPLDFIVPEGITILCDDSNIVYAPLTTINASGPDVEEIIKEFFMSTNIETMNFPKLITINSSAFNGCTSLTEINLPSLTTIGDNGFNGCTSLTEINLPSLTTIGDNGFNGCTSLTEINLPSLTTISDKVFNGCTSLTEINLPSLTTIGADTILGSNKVVKITLGSLISSTSTSFKQYIRIGEGTISEIYIGEETSADLYWQYSTRYTQEVLHLAIEHLADKTGQTAGNFVVGEVNIEKIDHEHIVMLENKNWNYS